ncbi:glycosyltransferase family 2 protein [Nemorincola caseinilytica]|uniref:Glycosyltransferase family 2 protein n=1 Tax=Nemorincola caseinilytica TaxID=2054315 RepID=A0ABP8NDK2_9BACT
MSKITIITPCYFNELNIPVYAQRMIENESTFPEGVTFEYVLVDDGSKDNTWAELEKFHASYPHKVKIIKLVRNFGSTNAVYSALPYATGDCIAIISADLQDPPAIIAKMYSHWQNGYKLVLANRTNREESFVQKLMANITHGMVRKWGLSNLPAGGFDLNLFDKEVRDVIVTMDDKNSFFPYLLIWLGYEYVSIPYVRQKRELGKSTYTLTKKIKVFVDSFVAFSFFPIRLISVLGLLLGSFSLILIVVVVISKIMGGVPITGWSSMMAVILFVSSFQMIGLGIIGEYVWRGLESSRKRPNYIVDKVKQ